VTNRGSHFFDSLSQVFMFARQPLLPGGQYSIASIASRSNTCVNRKKYT